MSCPCFFWTSQQMSIMHATDMNYGKRSDAQNYESERMSCPSFFVWTHQKMSIAHGTEMNYGNNRSDGRGTNFIILSIVGWWSSGDLPTMFDNLSGSEWSTRGKTQIDMMGIKGRGARTVGGGTWDLGGMFPEYGSQRPVSGAHWPGAR